jgi:hypothetical protein
LEDCINVGEEIPAGRLGDEREGKELKELKQLKFPCGELRGEGEGKVEGVEGVEVSLRGG